MPTYRLEIDVNSFPDFNYYNHKSEQDYGFDYNEIIILVPEYYISEYVLEQPIRIKLRSVLNEIKAISFISIGYNPFTELPRITDRKSIKSYSVPSNDINILRILAK